MKHYVIVVQIRALSGSLFTTSDKQLDLCFEYLWHEELIYVLSIMVCGTPS